jgi:uncharacterized protein (DUF433 family)
VSDQHISIRPHLQSGQPCLSGTRLPALQMASNYLDDGLVVLEWYDLDVEGLALCCYYAAQHGPRRFRVWREWARRYPLTDRWTLAMLPDREAQA